MKHWQRKLAKWKRIPSSTMSPAPLLRKDKQKPTSMPNTDIRVIGAMITSRAMLHWSYAVVECPEGFDGNRHDSTSDLASLNVLQRQWLLEAWQRTDLNSLSRIHPLIFQDRVDPQQVTLRFLLKALPAIPRAIARATRIRLNRVLSRWALFSVHTSSRSTPGIYTSKNKRKMLSNKDLYAINAKTHQQLYTPTASRW